MAKSLREIIEALWDYHGRDTKVSEWLLVEQASMDGFAKVTLDPDWMHIDPERAKREGSWDGTIAFGFWTLSMLTYFMRSTAGTPNPPGALYTLNYGLDRVRLMAPVPVGSRIRNHYRVLDIQDRGGSLSFEVGESHRGRRPGETGHGRGVASDDILSAPSAVTRITTLSPRIRSRRA